ncbi:hypothetical protein K445DRAFT_36843, partial [Daldinia sp. EC12]
LIFYRLCLHPLANIPGPPLAAATYLYEAYYELVHKGGAQYAPRIRELHKAYGPIVRINPDEVSVADARFHDQVYAPQPEIRDRHPDFSAALGTTNGSFSTPDHYLHRDRRVAYSQFFTSANVMASESLVVKKVNRLCELLSSDRDKCSELRTYFAAIAFDSFYTWGFGNSLELLDNLPFVYQCNQTIETLVTGPPVYRVFPSVLRIVRKIPPTILRHFSHHIARLFDLHAVSKSLLLTWRKMIKKEAERAVLSENEDIKVTATRKLSQPETLFSVLRRSKAVPEEKTAARMAHEGVEMLMASFTPGHTMMFGMYYLHSNPHVLETLRKELDEANPDPAVDLSFRVLNTLPYLRAVVKELLRISFPMGMRLPMICRKDIQYGEWNIPAYTAISVNHRGLVFDPEVFVEPLKFKPERWLDSANVIDEKRYYVPFGKGARMCPGREFASQLVQITLATLIQRFEFQLVDTVWERDVAASRESLLAAPAYGSKGIRLSLV